MDDFVRIRRSVAAAAAAVVVVSGTVAAIVVTGRQTGTSTLCGEQTRSVAGGSYVVQNNEYNSTAPTCITASGGTDFRVKNSSISNATDGLPGGYPSIYQGCHWGKCSSGGLAATPLQVSDLDPDTVTTTWSTSQPGSGSYYAAYDIWFNETPATTGQPDCTELMVWLNHHGPVQPFGTQIATGVSVGGRSYDIWAGQRPTWDTISYEMPAGTTSVSGLDIGVLAQDAVSRGYLSSSCYLISVEAGFGLWHGGAGLATHSFSVDIKARQ
jgi:Glycosyl hydrolase family 12